MKLWIPGANGFLGKTVQKICKKKEISFLATSKEEVDISSRSQVFLFIEKHSQDPITHIVNCAALAHVDLAEKNQDAAFAVNVVGPENLGKVAEQLRIPILHFSTEYIFNGSGSGVFSELDIPHPVGSYAITKREGELRLLSAYSKACVIRTSWLFGGAGKTFLSSLFSKMKTTKLLQIASDQIGRATYVEDLAAAIFFFFNHQGIFHFANKGEVSRYEIALTMRQFALEKGIPLLCEEIQPRTSDMFEHINKRPSSCILDTSKVEQIQGAPIRSWNEAVKDLVSQTN